MARSARFMVPVGVVLVIGAIFAIVLVNRQSKPQPTEPVGAQQPAPELSIAAEPYCEGWGIELKGTVTGATGRTIKDVTVGHTAVGTYPTRTFTFVDSEPGHVTGMQFTTWLPDKSGANTFPAGDAYSVNWTITVAFNDDGPKAIKSGTYDWSAMCG